MRRIWIGVGVLVVLLALGVLMMNMTDRQLSRVSETLKQASETPDWKQSVSLAKTAQQAWEQKWHLLAALTDHTDMDAVDELFAELEVYRKYGAQMEHAAVCGKLFEAVRDLEENHRFSWWNLL